MPLSRRVADLAPYELLCEVVDRGSLSRAAAARGISQPSASASIARLERQLGLRLLERGPTGSRPTEEGALVAGWARQLIDSAAVLDEELDALREHRQRRLRIAASFTIAEYLLPGWLSALRREAPAPDVQLAVQNSADVERTVLEGRADIGFVEGPGVAAGLESEPVGGDELVCIVGPGHPWAERTGPLPARELAATRLVMRERGSGTREVVEQALQACLGGALPEPLIELGSTTTVKQAVMDGTGPALLSALSVEGELRDGRLRAVPVGGVNFHRTFRAIWPARASLHPAALRLVRRAADRSASP